jgi:hypothetical protein
MTNIMFRAVVGISALSLAASAHAQTIDFDAITTGATVDKYYAGGLDSLGETGPDYGVAFTLGDWVTTTDFGETSQPNLAYSDSGLGMMDAFGGMTGFVKFSYGAGTDTTINIYSGLDGSGTLLASRLLTANSIYGFDWATITFSGNAHSVQILGDPGNFGWDDISFGGLSDTGSVPEPASWALMLGGFALVGGAMRRGKRAHVRFA